MMKVLNKMEKPSSLIHQKIRNASFVQSEENTQRFKYNIGLRINKYIKDKFIILKTTCNKIIQKPQIWLDKVDFKEIKVQGITWLLESFIEGAIINYTFWALLEWKFNIITLFAWGIGLKQILSIYERIKNHGATTTIPKK